MKIYTENTDYLLGIITLATVIILGGMIGYIYYNSSLLVFLLVFVSYFYLKTLLYGIKTLKGLKK